MLTCGIDIGSTNVKVVLADEDGRSRWVRSVATPRRHDGIGIATDAAQMVTLLEDLIILGWRETGGGKPLAAISAAGIGEDGICADENLQSLGLVIPWFDKRALPEVAEFSESFALTRNDFHTTAGKWMWMRKHRAAEIDNAKLWITLTDYASSLWCGEPFFCETLAARTGCYEIDARRWNDDALAFAKAPPLPRLLKAGDVAGTVRRGRLVESGAASSATLIVAGGHDHPIASAAIQRMDKTARIDSLGTANAIYGETRMPDPPLDGTGLEATVPALGGEGVALIGVTEFSAILLDSFGGEGAVRKLLDVPRLPGEPLAQGDGDQTRLRGLLENMALRARRFFETMDRIGVPHGPIHATGGWARSTALVELRASVFREPVTVVDEPELAALSAALLALEAATDAPAPFTARNVHVVDPLGRWSEAYASL
jgi:xylulokinase